MKPIVLMSTFNRPELLRQSLPQVGREAMSVDADLYIHDDQSDDEETLAMLAEAGARGINVFSREYNRRETNLNGHECTGMANVFAFKHILEQNSEWTHLIKVDDDTFWHPGGMKMMVDKYEQAVDDGVDVLWFSGITTINETELEDHGSYAITEGCCNAAVIFRREDLQSFVSTIPLPYIVNDGFDTSFLIRWAKKNRPEAKSVSIKPSVVYHTGLTGVHVRHLELNRNFIDGTDGITCV